MQLTSSSTTQPSGYVVLARKWRPAQFQDLVGQAHIIRTLMNAIRAGRVHQAYLFTGSRGIGKTSIARIFAKVLRCEGTSTQNADGIDWLKSCDQCASCNEITKSTSVDVIEIDGASNNGVEAVREIRENAKYLPTNGSRKIYIIDEVHMLTTAAFNALLKTLEEPPAHVIFVFATTEPHKIPATILSRCQRFDFRRVSVAQIQQRLREVSDAEGIAAEPAALNLIARGADGGMRDAMSLLDQVISFSGNQITPQSVRDSIGLIEGQALLNLLRGIYSRKPLEALEQVEQAYNRGHDLRSLTRSLVELLHASILAKIDAPRSNSIDLSDEEWTELKEISALRELEEIELIFQVFHYGMESVARSPQPKIVLDVLIVKCATAEALLQLDSAPSSSSGSPSPSQSQGHSPIAQRQTSIPVVAAPAITPTAAPAAPAQPVAAAAPVAPAATQTPRTWENFTSHVRTTRPLLASILEHGHSEGLVGEALTICFKPEDSYFREQLTSRIYSEQLLNLARDFFGKTPRVQIETGSGGESLASKREREHRERETQVKDAAKNHPMIMEARALFGGDLGPIELLNEVED